MNNIYKKRIQFLVLLCMVIGVNSLMPIEERKIDHEGGDLAQTENLGSENALQQQALTDAQQQEQAKKDLARQLAEEAQAKVLGTSQSAGNVPAAHTPGAIAPAVLGPIHTDDEKAKEELLATANKLSGQISGLVKKPGAVPAQQLSVPATTTEMVHKPSNEFTDLEEQVNRDRENAMAKAEATSEKQGLGQSAPALERLPNVITRPQVLEGATGKTGPVAAKPLEVPAVPTRPTAALPAAEPQHKDLQKLLGAETFIPPDKKSGLSDKQKLGLGAAGAAVIAGGLGIGLGVGLTQKDQSATGAGAGAAGGAGGAGGVAGSAGGSMAGGGVMLGAPLSPADQAAMISGGVVPTGPATAEFNADGPFEFENDN